MDAWRRARSVKGMSLVPVSKSLGSSHTHSYEIKSYSDAYIHNVGSAPKTTRSKSMPSWRFADPDLQRQRRVASYKVYTAEGKVKTSINRSLRWMKNKYIELRYGLI